MNTADKTQTVIILLSSGTETEKQHCMMGSATSKAAVTSVCVAMTLSPADPVAQWEKIRRREVEEEVISCMCVCACVS